jgi:hypothetical protein
LTGVADRSAGILWLMNWRFLAMAWLVASGALAGGCGYGHRELYPQAIQTVEVDIFQNHSFYRGVEFELTEAVIKEIELRTPYKVIRAGTADTVLRGSIVRVDQRLLSRRRVGGVPQELEMLLVVDFEWQDLRTGQTLRERPGLQAVGRYVPSRPVGEPLLNAQHQAVTRMADMVVSSMRADW